MRNIFILSGLLMFMACGGSQISIDTRDVKGTIDAEGAELIKGSLHTSDGNFEQAIIKYEDYEISIAPTTNTLNQIVQKQQESDEAFGITRSEIQNNDDCVFYKVNKDFAGEKSEGYLFFVMKKGKKGSFILTGHGKMFEPIPTKEKAETALKAAKTFKPTN